MNMRAALAVTGALVLLPPVPTFAQSVQVSGMVSLLGSGRFGTESEPLLGARVIPEVKLAIASGRGVTVDAEVSANAFGTVSFPSDDPTQASGDVKPYRAWLRLSTSRFEARAGLQKVSFGSATIFRPMMWFDSLDPRDPLQLTDGVYALLLRYFTASNASVSGWTMYGNDTRRGWDLAPPDRKTPEFGGRVQIPLFRGEVAATYHRRKAAIGDVVPSMDPPAAAPSVPVAVSPVPEERFGLDGKWDLGVGFWLEGALVHQKTPLIPRPYQLALNAGLDYTFGVGNGLTAVAEHFRLESSGRALLARRIPELLGPAPSLSPGPARRAERDLLSRLEDPERLPFRHVEADLRRAVAERQPLLEPRRRPGLRRPAGLIFLCGDRPAAPPLVSFLRPTSRLP